MKTQLHDDHQLWLDGLYTGVVFKTTASWHSDDTDTVHRLPDLLLGFEYLRLL